MLYKAICAVTIGISSICVLTQLILLPWLHQYTTNLKGDFESRLRRFHHNVRQFDEQLHRLGKLAGAGVLPLLRGDQPARAKRQIAVVPSDCPPPRVGSPGPVGESGEDGEAGDPGEDGSAGLDALTLLMQEAQKCVICPQGPAGPIGAPGHQGFPGPKGDKGEAGEPGTDGLDGEQGPEGLPGLPGIGGKPGKKGPPGSSAPGGTGQPGPPGVKGPIGQTGKQGERGRRNFVIGMPGPDGRSGKQGLDGLEGKPGGRGEKGQPGEDGADARFCPCPGELNTLGGGQKPRSQLAPPPSSPVPIPQAQEQPSRAFAAPPSPILPPSPPADVPERNRPPAGPKPTEKVEEEVQIGGNGPVKQPTSAVTEKANSVASGGTSLRIGQLRSGEKPTLGSDGAAQINYEDVYPNYENEEGGTAAGKGAGRKSGEDGKPIYDDEVQLNNGAEKQQQQQEVKPAPMRDGESTVDGEEAEEEQQDTAPSPTRRFVYVTKRPRHRL